MTMTDAPLGAHLIGGEWITAGPSTTSANPARPDEPVGEHPVGDASTAADAVSAAVDAKRMWRDMGFKRRAEILEAAGAKDISSYDRKSKPGFAIHEMGTARMGRDPKTSVLNGWCQSWDVPNLFVTDGAAMASSACQNPSLTYMALTARAAAYAAERLDRAEI